MDTIISKETGLISVFLDTVLKSACEALVSDIHIDTEEDVVLIKFRALGELRVFKKVNASATEEITGRIKVLSKLRTDIHDRGQDGRFTFYFGKEKTDIRVSVVPTFYGESVVLRILRPEIQQDINFNSLGFSQGQIPTIENKLTLCKGIILVSGATGSGKTTTIYSFINYLIKLRKNIITIEDPVEYVVKGVRQIQVHEKNFTFADGLRSVLRQDPEVIVVGEIRDPETAGLAFRAALTGHLVIASIHSNSVKDIPNRLLDLGVSRNLLSLITLSVGQGLVAQLDKTGQVFKRIALYELSEQNNNFNE